VSGPISQYFRADHARLDRLLQRAVAGPSPIDLEAFTSFRAGLLKHIALEEKILLPALRRRRGGEPLESARRLRVDHAAIAHLLVPSPTPALVSELRSILDPHNQLEEGPGGLYAVCDDVLEQEAAQLLEQARSYPDVKAAAFKDGPRACRVAAQALRLAERAVFEAGSA
jgi:hypothetical protein